MISLKIFLQAPRRISIMFKENVVKWKRCLNNKERENTRRDPNYWKCIERANVRSKGQLLAFVFEARL